MGNGTDVESGDILSMCKNLYIEMNVKHCEKGVEKDRNSKKLKEWERKKEKVLSQEYLRYLLENQTYIYQNCKA